MARSDIRNVCLAMLEQGTADEIASSTDTRWLFALGANFNITKFSWESETLGFHY
jgi:hypothetical protein